MMSESDFVFAWLLAARAGSEAASWALSREHALVEQARRVYKLIQLEAKEHSDETHSRTKD